MTSAPINDPIKKEEDEATPSSSNASLASTVLDRLTQSLPPTSKSAAPPSTQPNADTPNEPRQERASGEGTALTSNGISSVSLHSDDSAGKNGKPELIAPAPSRTPSNASVSLISQLKALMKEHETNNNAPLYHSLEFFPPHSPEACANLLLRVESMSKNGPIFVDVTSNPRMRMETLHICADIVTHCGVNVMFHLTCDRLTREKARELLTKAQQTGVTSIMALRGDLEDDAPRTTQDFHRASDLVRFIREEFGDAFSIGVAAYPEGLYGNEESYKNDMLSLKAKFDAGADFCITQYFFDVSLYLNFVKDCRANGIDGLIIPGIMPIQSYQLFAFLSQQLKVRVPKEIASDLERIGHDDEAVRAYGANRAAMMIAQLYDSGAPVVHFFTMNLEKTTKTVVDWLSKEYSRFQPYSVTKGLVLPWRKVDHCKRIGEDVRPIFWSNKPHSYLQRTNEWGEFPNGRWGDRSSPAYGNLRGSHYYPNPYGNPVERRKVWGDAPLSVPDVAEVFVSFVKGDIPFLPWSETGLALESGEIRDALINLNRSGFLTVNSQPSVNGVPSLDPKFGWGPPNGYVYQKAYVEFFVCEEGARELARVIKKDFPTLAIHAINSRGEQFFACQDPAPRGACAVTWGIFPGREVLQPTIVDPVSFVAWKEEAYESWTKTWASIYPESSPSYSLLWDIHDAFWLVNVVDDDYVQGNMWRLFEIPSVLRAAQVGLELVPEPV